MTRSPEPSVATLPVRRPDRSPVPPALWVFAGGKGGVGRSLLVANMGIQMARLGRKVAVVDFDLQGANLHTYLGFNRVSRTLEGLAGSADVPLPSLLSDTSVPSLKLLAGAQRLLTAAERTLVLERFLRQAASLPADCILVDCGSGRSLKILDLVRSARLGILVTSPEPPAAESLYLFAEALLQRVLESKLTPDDLERLEIARSLDEDGKEGRPSFRAAVERLREEGEKCCDKVLEAVRPLRLHLILNQVRTETEAEMASILRTGFEKFFGLELKTVGTVEYDLSVLQSIQKRKPLSQQYPNSPATQGIERAVSVLLAPFREDGGGPPPLAGSLSQLDHYRLLEVPPGASSKEIQQTYQILKRAYDPDSPFRHPLLSQTQIERIAAQVETAYRTLIFLETRSEYDRKLVAEGRLHPDQTRSPESEAPPAPALRTAPATGSETTSPLPVAARDDAGGPADSAPPPSKTPAEAPAPGRGLPVTGATLRERRESCKLSLENIVERTKIRPAILEALEGDRFADLPEPVFLKGFLRQLAACLGLDPGVVTREYMARIHPAPKSPPKPSR